MPVKALIDDHHDRRDEGELERVPGDTGRAPPPRTRTAPGRAASIRQGRQRQDDQRAPGKEARAPQDQVGTRPPASGPTVDHGVLPFRGLCRRPREDRVQSPLGP